MGQLKKLRTENIVKVINALYESGPSSKKMLSKKLGFSTALLTSICMELNDNGVIQDGESLKNNKAGRREVLIDINFDNKLIIGVTILSNKTKVVITNLKPQILLQREVETLRDDADGLLASVDKIIQEYITENNLSDSDFLGMGVGVKGGINSETGWVNKDLWSHKVNLRDKLTELTNIPVFIQNVTNNIAMAEYFYSQKKSDFVVIRHGMGVGGAIFKDGALLVNDNNTTGKIGHMIINREGEYCPICKRRGCLESMTSKSRLFSLIEELFQQNELPYLDELLDGDISKLNTKMIFEAYREGSVHLSTIFKDSAKYFAQAILSSYAVLGISEYVMHGSFFKEPEFFQLIRFYMQEMQCSVGDPNITLSTLDAEKTETSSVMLVLYRRLFHNTDKVYWRQQD